MGTASHQYTAYQSIINAVEREREILPHYNPGGGVGSWGEDGSWCYGCWCRTRERGKDEIRPMSFFL